MMRYNFFVTLSVLIFAVPGLCHELDLRASPLVPALELPANWTYLGCYSDTAYGRTLTGTATAAYAMTGEACIAFCASKGYPYAGTEYSRECFCGLGLGVSKFTPGECNMPCGGDQMQSCGGPNRLSVYANLNQPPPTTNPGLNGYTYQGCFTDNVYNRTLPRLANVRGGSGAMTVASCVAACFDNSYVFAGLEFSGECWCGSEILPGAIMIPGIPLATGCSSICQGNFSEYCGGPNRLDLYSFTDIQYIDNGDFEAGTYPWVTKGINPEYETGSLQAVISSSTELSQSFSSGYGSWNLYISDNSTTLSDITNSSICIGRVIDLEKAGRYNFSASVGRLIGGGTSYTNDLQWEVVLRHYTPTGLKDYRTDPPREVCSPNDPAHNCTAPAVNGQLVYELVDFMIPIVKERTGWYICYFCGIFQGEAARGHTLIADNLSIKGPFFNEPTIL